MKGLIEELFGDDLSFKEMLIYGVLGGVAVFGLFYLVALIGFIS
jgi:hypothetical protein